MTFEPPELHTSRLLLRPFHLIDLEDLFAIYSDEHVAFFALPGSTTRAEIERSLRDPASWEVRPRFAIVYDGRVVGDILLEIEQRDAVANLGYAIAHADWGRGIATEAAEAVVDYAFRTIGLAKVYARADPRNVGSVRVMEKLGMQREALLRSHVVRRGECCDRVYFGLLRDEWERRHARGMPTPPRQHQW